VSEQTVETAEGGGNAAEEVTVTDERERQPSRWIPFLEWFDEKVYVLVGITFLLAALFSLVYGLLAMGDNILSQMFLPAGFNLHGLFTKENGAQDIISLVSDLLLTLIIMEVLGTVVHHLQEGETTLRPFLFIGIISATRGILAVGARLSVDSNGTLPDREFIRDMVELGVNAIVIIALGITMKLIGQYLEEGAIPKRVRRSAGGRVPRSGGSGAGSSLSSRAVSPNQVLGVRTMVVLMILIILVALSLIGVLLSTGHL
jgi:uncharacterized membrane protein (DUF373 family)